MQFLGNGRLSSWATHQGGGGLLWRDQAITRWTNPRLGESQGYWLYINDKSVDDIWSVAQQPTRHADDEIQVTFDAHKIRYSCERHGLVSHLDAVVSPTDDIDIRRITLSNRMPVSRQIELSSYAEVVLGQSRDDNRHPAFSKLFVKSAFLPEQSALLFQRRPRDAGGKPPVLLHTVVFEDPAIDVVAYESDRERFIGRGGDMKHPEGLTHTGLCQSAAWTLDTIMSLSVKVTLAPFETKQLAFLTAVGESRQSVIDIIKRYPAPNLEWVFENARIRSQRELSQLGLSPGSLPNAQLLASVLLQPHPSLSPVVGITDIQAGNQASLWQFGISGDLPILLMRMADDSSNEMLELLIRCQHLWRYKGFKVDLVILRRGLAGYEEPLRERIMSTLRDTDTLGYLGRNGGVHLLSIDHLDSAKIQTIESLSTVVLDDQLGDLDTNLQPLFARLQTMPSFDPLLLLPFKDIEQIERPHHLQFDNEFGGFDRERREYLIHLEPGEQTPSPWCNVLANSDFGTIVSESGLGFTWAINSGEFQLTPWSNDPVLDSPSEVLYLRDEMQGQVWSITPLPKAEAVSCQIQHGLGYTRWRQNSHGLEQELLSFVLSLDRQN